VTVPAPDRRRPRSTTGIDRQAVGAGALALLDREGIDGFTMRRLAEELGVGTMTVYRYVRDKREALDAAVDAAMAARPPLSRSGDWRDDLRRLIEGAWRNLNRHPALVQIRFRQPVLRPEALRFGETGMAILLDAGLGEEEAAGSFRLLFTYVFGYAGLSPERAAPAARRQADAVLAGLDPEEYPNLRRSQDAFSAAMAGPAAFAYGLERILDGIAVALEGARGPR
jgi:AcrR family transcriptional regulator